MSTAAPTAAIPEANASASIKSAEISSAEPASVPISVGEVSAEEVVKASLPAPIDDGFALHGLPFILTMFSFCLGCFIAGLDWTIVVTAMPRIAAQFGAFDQISWIIISFLLTQTAGTPLWGRMADTFGRRECMNFALVSFLIGSIGCALAPNFATLVVFRAVQGIGGGGIFACALICVADLVPAHQRGAYIGPLAAVFGLSGVVGPILGGVLTDGPGWPYVFWINIPICLVCIANVTLFVPKYLGRGHLAVLVEGGAALKPSEAASSGSQELQLETGTIDYAGIVAIVSAVVCFCLGVNWGGSKYDWSSAPIVGLLCGAALFLALFCLIETCYASNPIIPLRLFGIRNFTVGAIINLAAGIVMTGSYVFLPVFFQYVFLQSATESGKQLIPMAVGLPVGAMLSGGLMTAFPRLGYRLWQVLGSCAMIAATVLYTQFTASTPQYHIIGCMILGGLALGPSVQVPLLAAQNAVDLKDEAVTSSTMTFFQSIGGLLGAAIMQTLLNNKIAAELAPITTRIAAVYGPSTAPSTGSFDVRSLAGLPPPLDTVYADAISAFGRSCSFVFWVCVAGAVVTTLASCCMEHIPLKGGAEAAAADAAKAPRAEPAAAAMAVREPAAPAV